MPGISCSQMADAVSGSSSPNALKTVSWVSRAVLMSSDLLFDAHGVEPFAGADDRQCEQQRLAVFAVMVSRAQAEQRRLAFVPRLGVGEADGVGDGDHAFACLAGPFEVGVFGQVGEPVRDASLDRFRDGPVTGLPCVEQCGAFVRAAYRRRDDPTVGAGLVFGVDDCDCGQLGCGAQSPVAA